MSKVLVISNNSFSKTNSNGRTLGNYFLRWSKDKLAQFCISTTEPDYDICNNYYCVPDKNAFDAFIHFKKTKRSRIEDCINTAANTKIISSKFSVKTATKLLVRHLIWKNRWNSKDFWIWVENFNPEVVLVMNSDSAFILDIARTVSEKKSLPLMMYNTEGFYFFDKDYMHESSFIDKISFAIYKRIYRKAFKKLMKVTSLSFHLNGKLCKDFQKEFGGRHEILYSSSSMVHKDYICDKNCLKFSYLGNFGFNRASALIEIAQVLREIDSSYVLHIYGRIPTKEIEEQFKKSSNIVLEGFIDYNKVKDVMYNSTILFHAESRDSKYEEILRYGFTTKIADSLSCGVPFLMYSLPTVAGADYLRETKAGWYAGNKAELKTCINEILNDAVIRNVILERAREISQLNHNEEKSRNKFKNLINEFI